MKKLKTLASLKFQIEHFKIAWNALDRNMAFTLSVFFLGVVLILTGVNVPLIYASILVSLAALAYVERRTREHIAKEQQMDLELRNILEDR